MAPGRIVLIDLSIMNSLVQEGSGYSVDPSRELLTECYELAQKLLDKGYSLQFAMSHALRHAYATGADRELERCLSDIHVVYGRGVADWLHRIRRSKARARADQIQSQIEHIRYVIEEHGMSLETADHLRCAFEGLERMEELAACNQASPDTGQTP